MSTINSILALDIGNTAVKAGIYTGGEPEVVEILREPGELTSLPIKERELQAFYCSVNGDTAAAFVSALQQEYGLSPGELTAASSFPFGIAYDTPETLGVDRICGLAGAFDLLEKQRQIAPDALLITIDCGTATTINIVDLELLSFTGGLIAPGIRTMFDSLDSATANLPRVSSEDYIAMTGKTTVSSIASGVLHATAGYIEDTLRRIGEETGKNLIAFITGGNAEAALPLISKEITYREHLVLRGIAKAAGMNL